MPLICMTGQEKAYPYMHLVDASGWSYNCMTPSGHALVLQVGRLERVFTLAAKALVRGTGLFAFSIELYAESEVCGRKMGVDCKGAEWMPWI